MSAQPDLADERRHCDPVGSQVPRGADGRGDREAEAGEEPREFETLDLVAIGEAHEDLSLVGQAGARGQLRLGEGDTETLPDAHDLAGRAHLGTEHRVDAGKTVERQHGLLHRHVGRHGRRRRARRLASTS